MNGFTSLHRLLGKKNKDVSCSTSNLSKSNSNLNLDTSSQYNKIVPIPLNNVPFEQTFRVTVYLPNNQLYVERIGAKTRLIKLLDDVCDNKRLKKEKFEFRHPGDNSQVYDINLTIGEVGLNELKLVLKTESRFNSNFHPDDMIRYRNNLSDSVSSSELSRNSKTIIRKSSPYSSSNSLNSLDSSGMGSNSKTSISLVPPQAPIRKKKKAPRPPSQNSIPEQEMATDLHVFKEPLSTLPRKIFHVSSPNLYNNNKGYQHIANSCDVHRSNLAVNYEEEIQSDSNNNINEHQRVNQRMNKMNTRPTSMFIPSSEEPKKIETLNNNLNSRMTYSEENRASSSMSRTRTSSESSEVKEYLNSDPVSRASALIASQESKKKKAAPAPPPRAHHQVVAPVPSPRTVQEIKKIEEESRKSLTVKNLNDVFQPNREDRAVSAPVETFNSSPASSLESTLSSPSSHNVSKVMLNVDTSSSLSSEESSGPVSIQIGSTNHLAIHQSPVTLPKVNNAHIEEKLASAVVSKTHIHHQQTVHQIHEEKKLTTKIDTYSDEDEMNVYNIILAKPVETLEPKTIIQNSEKKDENDKIVKAIIHKVEVEPVERCVSPVWTYTLPAPPTFADIGETTTLATEAERTDSKYFNDLISTAVDNETILSDSRTILSDDTDIKPVIRGRILLNESFGGKIESPKKNGDVITSDIEDGYHGDRMKVVRELMIVKSNDIKELEAKRREIIRKEELLNKRLENDTTKQDDATRMQKIKEREMNRDVQVIRGSTEVLLTSWEKEEASKIAEFHKNRNCWSYGLKPKNVELQSTGLETATKQSSQIEDVKQVIQESWSKPAKIQDPVPVPETIKEDLTRTQFEKQQNIENIRRNSETYSIEIRSETRNNLTDEEPKKPNVKKNSQTQITHNPRNILRSDSFHSIGQQRNSGSGMISSLPKSTSYLSLINAQNNELSKSSSNGVLYSKRKSTSELSIHEAPSLQSLEIIKSILNSSRKNSLQSDFIVKVEPIIKQKEIQDMDLIVTGKSSTTTTVSSSSISTNSLKTTQKSSDDLKGIPEDSKWKYQGPPKINMGTWSERPKIEVSIKSDSDYKFGGSSTLPRGYKNSNQNGNVVNISNVVLRSSKDIVDAGSRFTLPSSATNGHSDASKMVDHSPKVLSVEYKKNVPGSSFVNIKPRPMSMDAAKLWNEPATTDYQSGTQTLSFNRMSTSHNKFVPKVRGFKLNDINENENTNGNINTVKIPISQPQVAPISVTVEPAMKIQQAIPVHLQEDPPKLPNKPTFVRSTSAGDINKKFRFTTYENRNESSPPEVPFGQNTLRRTGLKEKIIMPDEQKDQKNGFGRVLDETKGSTYQTTLSATPQSSQAQKPIEAKVIPPPPPPKIIQGVKKSFSVPAPAPDARDQLMDGIRNFNFNSLKKK